MRKNKNQSVDSSKRRAARRKSTNPLAPKKKSDEFSTPHDEATVEFDDDAYYDDYETIHDVDDEQIIPDSEEKK